MRSSVEASAVETSQDNIVFMLVTSHFVVVANICKFIGCNMGKIHQGMQYCFHGMSWERHLSGMQCQMPALSMSRLLVSVPRNMQMRKQHAHEQVLVGTQRSVFNFMGM